MADKVKMVEMVTPQGVKITVTEETAEALRPSFEAQLAAMAANAPPEGTRENPLPYGQWDICQIVKGSDAPKDALVIVLPTKLDSKVYRVGRDGVTVYPDMGFGEVPDTALSAAAISVISAGGKVFVKHNAPRGK